MISALSFTLILLAELILELVFWLGFPLYYPILLYKKYTAAINPKFADSKGGILIHAASVGEINALKILLVRLRELYPDTQLVITTTTVTGLKAASAIDPALQTGLSVLDVWHLRKKQLDQINPGLICIMETEIWFNVLAWAKLKRCPLLFLNARISERSLQHYTKIRPLLDLVSPAIKEIMAQTEADAKRFRKLFKAPVSNAGNLKYALDLPVYNNSEIRQQWGYNLDNFILVWGSSRPGEEALIVSLLPLLHRHIPKLKLILAIRHPKRIHDVLKLIPDHKYSLFSKAESAHDLHIIDELGHLNQAYAICDLAIVGGSFFDFGGHNPLEPAFYKKAIIMGSYYSSCLDSVQQLKQQNAILISSADNLARDITNLAENQELRSNMGRAAKAVLSLNAESLDKHLEMISHWMK